jgi:hypothetical protein
LTSWSSEIVGKAQTKQKQKSVCIVLGLKEAARKHTDLEKTLQILLEALTFETWKPGSFDEDVQTQQV